MYNFFIHQFLVHFPLQVTSPLISFLKDVVFQSYSTLVSAKYWAPNTCLDISLIHLSNNSLPYFRSWIMNAQRRWQETDKILLKYPKTNSVQALPQNLTKSVW